MIVGPPTTAAGARTLAIPANVTDLLADHLERYVRPQRDAWVFATAAGGPVRRAICRGRGRTLA